MKKILIVAAIGLFSCGVFGQQEDWACRTTFVPTANCPDSVHCYQTILVDVNMDMVRDSTCMVFSIGTTAGSSDIYNRRCLKRDIHKMEGVTKIGAKIYRVDLGSFLVSDENFFVSYKIE